MTIPPIPVVFTPIYKPKPWGGQRLATHLGKSFLPDAAIGESWELVSLPGHESCVRDGPLEGRALADLVRTWGAALLGKAELSDGRFPLLIKFLDACENLSVQVHPRPMSSGEATPQPGVKHECWYVIRADPGARLYIGLAPDVGPNDVMGAANTPAMVNLLRAWDAQPGQCYHLPSGTPHALGAGVVVAEIQTPSDVTYRLYDWDRAGLDGRPRELHIDEALRNIRYDVTGDMIAPPPRHISHPLGEAQRVAECSRFCVDQVDLRSHGLAPLPPGFMRAWVVLSGEGRIVGGESAVPFTTGAVVLIPARSQGLQVEALSASRLLEVTIPRG